MGVPSMQLLAARKAAAGGAVAAVTFLQSTSSGTDASSYTFAAQNLGTADADRTIVVVFGARKATTFSISSVSVAGVSATHVVTQLTTTSAYNACTIWAAAVPTGTSGDVVVTLDSTVLRVAVALYRCTGITVTAADTATASGHANTTPLAPAVDATDNGAVIAGVFYGGTGAVSWSAVTEDIEQQAGAESAKLSTASDEFASPGAVSVSITPDANWIDGAAVAAAW